MSYAMEEALNAVSRMSRKQAWAYYDVRPKRVDPVVFLDVFKTIYNAIEANPEGPLVVAAPEILKQLEK